MTGSAGAGSAASAESPARKTPPPLSSYSRFVQRLRRRYADELALLPAGAPERPQIEQAYAALRERGHPVGDALRIARQLVMERLITLDCDQQAELSVVTTAVTQLAEFALDVACRQAEQELEAVHGAPMGEGGQRARLWVIGMGKLGARELNVSSDIDLIYVFDQAGETAGNEHRMNRVSNQ